MQIIKGMHLNKKLNELAEHLQGPAYIITDSLPVIFIHRQILFL